jgi:hypothetical protein
MGTHTCIVSRAGSNASDTSTAVAFAWQVGAGTGTNPVNATDFPGGTFPSGTGTIAAGAASATITFQSNPDTTFEPDETGALTVTTSQSGVTIIGSPQPFTIANDDADPGSGSTTVYGPMTTGDTGLQAVGSANMRMEHPYVNARVAGSYMLGLDGSGNGVALHQLSDSQYHLRRVTAGSVGDPSSGSDASILNGSTIAVAFADGDTLAVELVAGRVTLYKNGVAITGPAYPYDVSAVATGTGARYVKWAGSTVTNLKIIRL